MVRSNRTLSLDLEIRWPALPIWVLGWVLLIRLDGWLNLGNLALLLVLFSAIAGMWLSALASMAISGMSVLMFNWLLVEPRHTFHVLQDQDLLLLITMLVVSAVVSFLMARWRWAAELESQHARYSDELRHWAEQFREASDMPTQAELLHNALTPLHSGAIGIGLLEDDVRCARSGHRPLRKPINAVSPFAGPLQSYGRGRVFTIPSCDGASADTRTHAAIV